MKKSELRQIIREEILKELGRGLGPIDRKRYNLSKGEQPKYSNEKKPMKKEYHTLLNYFMKIAEKMGGGKHGKIVKVVYDHYADFPVIEYIFEDGNKGIFSYDNFESGDMDTIMYGGKAKTMTKGNKLIKKKEIPVGRGNQKFKKMLKAMVDAYKDVTEQ